VLKHILRNLAPKPLPVDVGYLLTDHAPQPEIATSSMIDSGGPTYCAPRRRALSVQTSERAWAGLDLAR
jgi:hypothetical protein